MDNNAATLPNAAALAQRVEMRAAQDGWTERPIGQLQKLMLARFLPNEQTPEADAFESAYKDATRHLTTALYLAALEEGLSAPGAFMTLVQVEHRLAENSLRVAPSYMDEWLAVALPAVQEAHDTGEPPERQIEKGFAILRELARRFVEPDTA